MTKKEEKQHLRRTIRRMEAELPAAYLETSNTAIAAHLLAMPAYQAAKTVFCFIGAGTEINTQPILVDALACGKRLCVPLCTAPGLMEPRQITGLSELSPGAYEIPAPPPESAVVPVDGIDFAVLPCMTCSRGGRRLGRGGGYYDRFLSQYRGGAVLLCRERLIREEIPIEVHDIPIPWVLTERALYEDGAPARLG
ncbi:MAG: 5-formyltetrahydrofolate cyclo-ligase [Oscillibacter sp.]|nr:5-formyltetrahydrofolate cyclo-ligase [Oscillibacter sp.]